MKIDGACLCGSIQYEAVIDPAAILVCHCTDCQINGGGAFRWGTLVPRDDFTLLAGTLKFYRKTAASGRERAVAFCGDCGTSLYGTQADTAETYSLRIGTARQARSLRPSLQIWHGSAYDWTDQLDEVPALDTQP
ncbi:MAG: GFA family protein [Novosphingobium sp.]|jgi:hypothetical protein|uniref:GFA family protein n=1 Tax=Novosphingobium sp. TaxID=1874826 RepID=UPI003918AA49|nr:GFA family protein [Novosphingobium sp.]